MHSDQVFLITQNQGYTALLFFKGRVPTGNITQQISRMGTIAKNAARGSALLTVVGLGLACNDIANTDNT